MRRLDAPRRLDTALRTDPLSTAAVLFLVHVLEATTGSLSAPLATLSPVVGLQKKAAGASVTTPPAALKLSRGSSTLDARSQS